MTRPGYTDAAGCTTTSFKRGIYLVDVEGVSAPVERLRQLAELLDRNLLRLQELRLQEIRPVLHQVEERLKPALVQLTPKPTVEYEEHSEAVAVRYLTREFQVHARSKTGDWSTKQSKPWDPTPRVLFYRLTFRGPEK